MIDKYKIKVSGKIPTKLLSVPMSEFFSEIKKIISQKISIKLIDILSVVKYSHDINNDFRKYEVELFVFTAEQLNEFINNIKNETV